ncbi:MAG TPA: S-layer homology domain-containing protein, partial [Anaerovoracaceae bacterium]|nr:S-layer homology domain-containing protein [Anaerovoracaceae bacterium]
MKTEKRKAISFVLTMTLIISCLLPHTTAYGEESVPEPIEAKAILSDINGHWGESAIQKAVDAGFVLGYEDGTFKPNNAVKRAEFVSMVNKALQLRDENTLNLLYSDVKKTDWFYTDIQKASYARYVSGVSETSFMPKKNITRQEAASMLARILPKSGGKSETALSGYPDAAMISSWARAAMALVVERGYLKGYGNGNLAPSATLTRAEAAKIIGMILEKEIIVREDVSLKNVNEILQNKIHVGNITIEKSVGEGDALLENLTALSKVYVLGGGTNTVTVSNSTIIQLIVCKEGTKVRVLSDGDTSIYEAFLFNENLLVNSQGQGVNSGEGGYENIINFNGVISVETAIKIAGEIAKRIDSTGKITMQQVKAGISAIVPESTASVNEDGSFVVSLQGVTETEEGKKGSGTPATVPGPPIDVRGTVKDGLHAATFTVPVSNGGRTITSYTVYAYDNGTLIATSSGIAAPIAISGLTVGNSYTFKVTATNAVGSSTESALSEPVVPSEINGKAAMLSSFDGSHCDCGLSTTAGGFEYKADYYPDITSAEPVTGYAINTEVQLQHLALHKNANAVLMHDMDFTGIAGGSADPSSPMGALEAAVSDYGIPYTGHLINDFTNGNFVPIGKFNVMTHEANPYTGIFSGNDKKITGLSISGVGAHCVGLFGHTSGADIKDFSLINGTIAGGTRVGGAVGYQSGGTVSAVYQTGTVTAVSGVVGGIVGWSTGMITDCVNTGEVHANSHAGGIVGITERGTVKNCFNTGQISCIYNAVGGIAGDGQRGTVTDCYNAGPIMGGSLTAGIVGWSIVGEIINNSANSGIVIVQSGYAGGIAGQSTGPVRALYNTGAIYGAANVGGIVGYNSPDASIGGAGQISDSFNAGAVSAGTAATVG